MEAIDLALYFTIAAFSLILTTLAHLAVVNYVLIGFQKLPAHLICLAGVAFAAVGGILLDHSQRVRYQDGGAASWLVASMVLVLTFSIVLLDTTLFLAFESCPSGRRLILILFAVSMQIILVIVGVYLLVSTQIKELWSSRIFICFAAVPLPAFLSLAGLGVYAACHPTDQEDAWSTTITASIISLLSVILLGLALKPSSPVSILVFYLMETTGLPIILIGKALEKSLRHWRGPGIAESISLNGSSTESRPSVLSTPRTADSTTDSEHMKPVSVFETDIESGQRS